jgi:predicted DsbA family dithiol-disulfide isomerase
VVEYTDPACPWAWGSEPKFRWLRLALEPLDVRWRRVFGILFDEDDDPPPDPDAEAAWYADFVAGISRHTGAPHAETLSWVARTSWPSSLAAKAAEAQGKTAAEHVLRRLRETTFVAGRPADEPGSVLAAVCCVPGLDVDRLARDMAAQEDAVRRDWAETRKPCAEVLEIDRPGPHNGRAKEVNERTRYALPTLVFTGPRGRKVVPGWRPLAEYADAVGEVTTTSLTFRPIDADEALRRFGSVTEPELELLTGDHKPPENAVRVPTGNGPLWIDPDCWDVAYAD